MEGDQHEALPHETGMSPNQSVNAKHKVPRPIRLGSIPGEQRMVAKQVQAQSYLRQVRDVADRREKLEVLVTVCMP